MLSRTFLASCFAMSMFVLPVTSCSAKQAEEKNQKQNRLSEATLSQFQFRGLGPAFMSGRVSDIAFHPTKRNTFYVAVGSGGVWKTENSGTTWTPIFDGQKVYSIGTLAVDPSSPETLWVGTGENVGGRHVSFGDGIYKSEDGGASWKHYGLKKTKHISKIIIHPNDSNIMWVAAQGPLWTKGGERGLYMTEDGGKKWSRVLGDDEWTGVTDIAIDPRDPSRLYAATWQRHRTVAAYMGGGPKSGLHRSLDGGKTWQKLSKGLPAKANIGKIGLGISPQNPDVIYAALELEQRKGAVYRSSDRGVSWTKMSDAVAGGTGPHYYQELYVSPHRFDEIYLADVWLQRSYDGGKTFSAMRGQAKHPDHHALGFRQDDPNYLLLGSDGGLYESFDKGKNWRFLSNLPTLQFYKIAVDDAKPFYNVYGGTQDNASQVGPSRTLQSFGIRNSDWSVVLAGDGHQPATEPGNPNIAYAQWQQGNLNRIDRKTGEKVAIQPQPAPGEPAERYNWDAPILVSPHSSTRLYFASQRIWMSNDRGDSWTAISGDLTKNQRRVELPIMGRKWGWHASWDLYAMSNYNTITSLAESPKVEGLIYAGTDDGLLQITEDAGKNWRKISLETIKGIPSTAFVNDIKADHFDPDTVYVSLDNHKYGDYKPYLIKSTNRGKSWTSMAANLPENHLVWRLVQDHKDKNLFFLGTEFGVFASFDAGKAWHKMKGGLPTIAVRDLTIHPTESDLVLGTFGRGIFILDDISPLRQLNEKALTAEAILFDVKDTWWYHEQNAFGFGSRGFQGQAEFFAKNPKFGANFTYYLKEDLTTSGTKRKKDEAEAKSATFPKFETLLEESIEREPKIWLTITDASGKTVRRLSAPTKKGFHRFNWDLRRSYPRAVTQRTFEGEEETYQKIRYMASPGTYTVSLSKEYKGKITALGEPKSFEVKRLTTPHLEGQSLADQEVVIERLETLEKSTSRSIDLLRKVSDQVKTWQKTLELSALAPGSIDEDLANIHRKAKTLNARLVGERPRQQIGEKQPPTIFDRIGFVKTSMINSSYGATPSALESLQIAEDQLMALRAELETLINQDIVNMQKILDQDGIQWNVRKVSH